MSLALVVAVVPQVLADTSDPSLDDGMSFSEPSVAAPDQQLRTEQSEVDQPPAAAAERSGEQRAEGPAVAEVQPEDSPGDQDGSGRAGQGEQRGSAGGCSGDACSLEPPPGDATAASAGGDGARRLLARISERLGWSAPGEPADQAGRPLTQRLADVAESSLRVLEARQAVLATDRRTRSVSEHVEDQVRLEEAQKLLGLLVEATAGTPESDRMRALASRGLQAEHLLNADRYPPVKATPLRMADWHIREAEIAFALRQATGSTATEEELQLDREHLDMASGELDQQRRAAWWARRPGQVAKLTQRAEQAQRRLTGEQAMSLVEAPGPLPVTEQSGPRVPGAPPTVANGPNEPGTPPAVAVAPDAVKATPGSGRTELDTSTPPSQQTPAPEGSGRVLSGMEAAAEAAVESGASTAATKTAILGLLGAGLYRVLSLHPAVRALLLTPDLSKVAPWMGDGSTPG